MTTYKKNIRNTAILITAFILLSFSGWLWVNNKDLKKSADKYKLHQDSLFASKLLLDKEIDDLNTALKENKNKNALLDSAINKTNILLKKKIKIINSLTGENASVKRLKKELKDLKDLRLSFEKQIQMLLVENARLKEELSRLKEQLANQSVIPKPEVLVTSDNFRVSLQKSNSKLTLKARRVKNLNVIFEVKSNSKDPVSKTLYIVAKDAHGNVITGSLPANSASVNGENISYSVSQKLDISESIKKVNVTIKTCAKIKTKGVIKIMIYSENDGLIGSTETTVI